MTDRDRIEKELRALAPPALPPALKERILRTAGAALKTRAEEPDLWTRLWESRPLRLAWATALVLLTAAHVSITPPPAPAGPDVMGQPLRGFPLPLPDAIAGREDDEVLRLGRLPAIDSRALPRFERSNLPDARKENPS